MICHSWKVMFHAEYSSGQPLKILTDLRMVVTEALSRTERGPLAKSASVQQSEVNRPQSQATVVAAIQAPEFEIATTQLQPHEE
jgi:hypothetical protein